MTDTCKPEYGTFEFKNEHIKDIPDVLTTFLSNRDVNMDDITFEVVMHETQSRPSKANK